MRNAAASGGPRAVALAGPANFVTCAANSTLGRLGHFDARGTQEKKAEGAGQNLEHGVAIALFDSERESGVFGRQWTRIACSQVDLALRRRLGTSWRRASHRRSRYGLVKP